MKNAKNSATCGKLQFKLEIYEEQFKKLQDEHSKLKKQLEEKDTVLKDAEREIIWLKVCAVETEKLMKIEKFENMELMVELESKNMELGEMQTKREESRQPNEHHFENDAPNAQDVNQSKEKDIQITAKIATKSTQMKTQTKRGRSKATVESKSKIFVCRQCLSGTNTFKKLSGLQSHERNSHKIKLKNHQKPKHSFLKTECIGKDKFHYHCFCGRTFGTRNNLSNHVLALTNGKLFKCPECEIRLYSTAKIRTHMKRVHEGCEYNGFGCRKCGKVLKTMKELQIHRVEKH